jgi:mono/diheme cytochrome c family protein
LVAAAVVVLGGLTLVAFRSSGTSAATPSAAAVVLDGADVFRAKGCIACHDGPEGANSDFDVGPNLRELPAVASRRVAGLDAASYVRQSIQEPQAYVVKGHDPNEVGIGLMPALGLTPAEIEALVAWLLP